MFEPDDFSNDPYGYWTNQVAHALQVGFLLLVYGVTLGWWYFAGEFPQKEWIIGGAAVGYGAYELIDQGWQGWDTVEDWVYVVVYGVAGPVTTFTEIEPGSTAFRGDLLLALPFVIAFTIHLCIGSWMRARRVRS